MLKVNECVCVCVFVHFIPSLLFKPLLTVYWCVASTAVSWVSPVARTLLLNFTHTHTLTGEVQQWLEEGKIQHHFLIYGL